jgi:curved DNA-binding protein CbpA
MDPQREREITEKRRVISSMTDGYDTYDYYELLGVPRDATAEQIQTAFFDAAKRFHPDKLGAELADLRVSSARLFARMSEARQTLTEPLLRQQYDAKLGHGVAHDDGEDEQKRIHEIINAATSFQKAEVLLKKRMLAEAEKEARRAHEADPEQADYLALLAWINASKTESLAQLPESLGQLNMAVAMSPENDKIRFYRAQILSRLGRKQEALVDYKFVVTKNPRNIDAQRELRLSEMRKSQISAPAPIPAAAQPQSGAPQSKGGVFSKFFKR